MPIAGASLRLDPSGAVYWPDMRTLIVADLHLEKGSAFARRGVFLPPYDTSATLTRLNELCVNYRPEQIIALGDSFHDREGPSRLLPEDRALLDRLNARHAFVWIAGNHDGLNAPSLGGVAMETYPLGPLTFRHDPRGTGAQGEISGHLHPCARIVWRGRSLRRRCFVSDGDRLILPAFGAFTGGLDIFDRAFYGLFAHRATAWLLGERAVHAFALHALRSV